LDPQAEAFLKMYLSDPALLMAGYDQSGSAGYGDPFNINFPKGTGAKPGPGYRPIPGGESPRPSPEPIRPSLPFV